MQSSVFKYQQEMQLLLATLPLAVISMPAMNTDNLLKGPTTNSLESHTTPTFYFMIILFALPTVYNKLPCYIVQSTC